MPKSELRPTVTLAAASLMIGVLAQSNWFFAYAGALFFFAFVLGYRWLKPISLWMLILALGAPLVNLAGHLAFQLKPGVPAWEDCFRHLGAALVAILPGVGAGALYRRLSIYLHRNKPQPSTTA
jgi:hypothetical protein